MMDLLQPRRWLPVHLSPRSRSPRSPGALPRALSAMLCVACLGGALLSGCGPSYRLEPPEDFKRFHEDRDLKYITADGVRLKVRTVQNYPVAPLTFWTDAMQRHLVARGYAFKLKSCFQTKAGLPGCTLDFVTPHGSEDWVLSETLFVSGDSVVVLEAAGPFDRFAALEKRLRESFKTFSLAD